jgi:hypothetical protein
MPVKKISKKGKIILFILLIVLNLVLRIPSIPHEKGEDSFFIHALANSLTTFGEAKWWLNWMSIFGLYPDSYASGLPFSISGMAQLIGLTGIEMEKTILLFSVLFGLFSIFTAYVFAGMIYDDFIFKYFLALFFSACQGVLVFSTWEVSARGPFIIFMPLFLFILLKKMHYLKTVFLLLILIIYVASVHHYFWFLFIFITVYISLKILSKSSNVEIISKFRISNMPHSIDFLYFIGLLTLFSYPFFSRTMITSGSRYGWISDMLMGNTRYVGPIILLAAGGLTYLLFKQNKKFEEWYILGIIFIFIPFLYNLTYSKYLWLLLFIFLITVAFRNFLYGTNLTKNKMPSLFILLIILSFVSFSAFYNYERTGNSKNYWYMQDATFEASKWSNNFISDNAIGFGNEGETWRFFAASDAHPLIPTVGTAALAYNLINESSIEFYQVSPYTSDFYFEGPYIEKSGTSLWGTMKWFLERRDIDDTGIAKNFNFKYFIEDSYNFMNIIPSIHNTRNSVYSNGRINIWNV